MKLDKKDFVGEILNNRWVVGPQLGAGRSGLVFQVTDNSDEHLNAVVKVAAVDETTVDNSFYGQEEELLYQAQSEMVHEIITLQKLDDKAPILRVPKVLDFGTHGENNFFITTRFEETVEKLHEDAGWKFSNAEIMFISLQVYQTMSTLHSLGQVRGDIKEGNVARGLGADKDNFYLIDFGRSKSLVTGVSTISSDKGAFLDMMVRLFRGGSAGLVPEHDEDDTIFWSNILDEEVRQMKKNVDDAVEARNKQGMPIPDPIKVLLQESIEHLPAHRRMAALLREAYVQTVDPNEALFDSS
ncbi:Protein kinase [Gracilaria domingensis]|nr:Protein kinase [Gracilaria domingensis]